MSSKHQFQEVFQPQRLNRKFSFSSLHSVLFFLASIWIRLNNKWNSQENNCVFIVFFFRSSRQRLWSVSCFNEHWWHTNTIYISIYMLCRDTQSPSLNKKSLSLTKPSCLSFVNHLKAWQMCIGSFRASLLKAVVSLSFTPTSLTHTIVLRRRIAWRRAHMLTVA